MSATEGSEIPASRAGGTRLARCLSVYDTGVGAMSRALDGWFVELSARLVFAAVLLPYYLNSAATKPGEGVFGILAPSAGAFAQILPAVAERYVYDTSAIPVLPWHLIVIAGTLAEFVLPVLIVAGLFARPAALGMIAFMLVQTWVDLAFHGAALGAPFDGQPGDLVDQRLLWLFVLGVLAVRGAGAISLDAVLLRRRGRV